MATPPTSRRGIWLGAGLIALAALFAWRNSFAGPFIFDDAPAIEQNQTIRHWSTAWWPPNGEGVTVSGRPLLNLSFALNYALSGPRVWSYHAFNLAIHLLAGLTLFGIVRRTLRGDGRREAGDWTNGTGLRPPLSGLRGADATVVGLAVALLWTVHPLQTESVTYIVQRAESLMGLFYLLTLYCFIRGVEGRSREEGAGRREQGGQKSQAQGQKSVVDEHIDPRPSTLDLRPGTAPPALGSAPLAPGESAGLSPKAVGGGFLNPPGCWFALSALACLLGMACKEVMVSAPLLVLLYDRTFVAGSLREAWRQRWRFYAALAAIWIILAALVVGTANRGGTAGFGIGVGFGQYLATQFEAIARYLWLSIWPHPLILDYGALWARNAADIVPGAIVVGGLIVAIAWALFRNLPSGFLGAWFFAILAPTSLVPGNRQTIAEHRMYLALAPVIAGAVVGAHRLLQKGSERSSQRSEIRSQKSEAGLPSHGAWAKAAGPGPSFPHSLLPSLPFAAPLTLTFTLTFTLTLPLAWLTAQRNTDYRSDLVIWRDVVAKRPPSAWAHHNLACVLLRQGAAADALTEEQAALRLKPDLLEAAVGAAHVLQQLGRESEAITYYQLALTIEPNHASAHESLGAIFARTDRLDEALEHYAAVVRIAPLQAPAHFNLAMVLTQLDRLDQAIAEYQTVLRLKPDTPEACYNLGAIFQKRGRVPEARAQFEQALRLQPDNAAAHNNLGNILARAGEFQGAIDHYQAALRIAPKDAVARYNLGTALLQLGRAAEARAQFEAALQIEPHFTPAREALDHLEKPR